MVMPFQVTQTAEERFWPKVEKAEWCWVWKGAKTRDGYGIFWFQRRLVPAHRASYLMFRGIIPDGLQIDHLCRNRACVNPDHLEVVSPRTNQLRGFGFSGVNARKTHCPRGHPLVEGNISVGYFKRTGKRTCLTCLREQGRLAARKRGNLVVLKSVVNGSRW